MGQTTFCVRPETARCSVAICSSVQCCSRVSGAPFFAIIGEPQIQTWSIE